MRFCRAVSGQRAGARDDHGHPRLVDAFGAPLTFRSVAVAAVALLLGLVMSELFFGREWTCAT